MQAQGGVPLDVLGGESARLRGYGVGFGVLRAFRAEAPVEAPRVGLLRDLTYRDGVLEGTITNRSDEALESVAVTWAGQVADRRGCRSSGRARPRRSASTSEVV